MQAEEVDFALIVGCTQFDTGHDTNAMDVGGANRLGNTVHRVVVGERNGGEPCRLRRRDHGGRGFGTIGRCRVGMEVDMRPVGPANAGRCSAHFA